MLKLNLSIKSNKKCIDCFEFYGIECVKCNEIKCLKMLTCLSSNN